MNRKYFLLFFLAACFYNTISLYSNGNIDDVNTNDIILENDTYYEIQGNMTKLKAGSRVYFYNIDNTETDIFYKGTLAEDTAFIIQGVEVIFKQGYDVAFYDGGNFKYGIELLENPFFRVQNREIECGSVYDIYNPIRFHDNGTPFSIRIVEDTSFSIQEEEVIFKGGTRLNFFENENLAFGTVKNDSSFKIQNQYLKVKADSYVTFFENENLHEASNIMGIYSFMVQDKNVQFKSNSYIAFANNGNLINGYLKANTVFRVYENDVEFKANTNIGFHENGNVFIGSLMNDVELNIRNKNMTFKSGTKYYVSFHENGSLKTGFISITTEITDKTNKSISVPAGSFVEFDADGKLVRYSPGG